jgi:hypothetical protein
MACSTIPILLLLNKSTNKGIPPLSMILWHWIVVPEATFVNAHVAYNCNWGYYVCFTY